MSDWRVAHASMGTYNFGIYDETGSTLAVLKATELTADRVYFIARLMAAAPDLLALVQTANSALKGSHTVMWQKAARAAVTKALGATSSLSPADSEAK